MASEMALATAPDIGGVGKAVPGAARRSDPESAPKPLHLAISTSLAGLIASGAMAPGTRIPSERQLSQSFGASRMTVRQALRGLAERGLLETRPGRGTFVARAKTPRVEQALSTLSGFTEALGRAGHQVASLVLHAGQVLADDEAASALNVAPGTGLHRLVRARLVDGVPAAVETAEIPVAVLPDLLERGDFSRASIYDTLKAAGVRPSSAEQTLSAGQADAVTAQALHVAPESAVLRLTRRTHDQAGRPIEFVRSSYRGDIFVMTAVLSLEQ